MNPGERPAEAIEHDIARTRERMSVHLDALGHKLSPEHLKQRTRQAILGKAQETNSRVLAFVRRHRVPLAAAAVGTAVVTLRSGRRAVGRGLAHRHPLGFALVAGVVGLALGVMAPDEERI